MNLRMVSIESDGSVRIAADGPITSTCFQSPADNNPLQLLLGAGWARHRVMLDMARADHIDSCALGWLINCHREFEENHGLLVLHSVQPKVLRILKTLKLDTIIPMVDNELAALNVRWKEAA